MKRLAVVLVALLLMPLAHAAPYQIQHLEPLNWWVGMKSPRLELMVHGENIAELSPRIHYPGVKLVGVRHTDSKNYLFIDLIIARDTKAGAFDIDFRRGANTVVTARYRLDERRTNSAQRKGFDAGDAVYLITPDRFANGDPGNDVQPGMPDKTDRNDPIARHGGDIKGMLAHLDYIKDMGFTMIWPTPLLENNQDKYSYHGYSLTDYYRIDPRFGTNEDFRQYVAAANKLGIGVIDDVVVNHIGTGHWWMKDLPASDWLNYQTGFVPTNNQHSTVQDIHAAPEERQRFLDGWFVESMPDMNQRNPLVARYLIQNTLWWIEYANLSGIREDTYSYADKTFLAEWCKAVLDEYPNLNIVGEEMNDHPHVVAYWQKGVKNRDGYASGLPSLMDFPVVDLMPSVLNAREESGAGFIQLYEMIANDFVYADPMQLMVFPDNHDRSRIYSLLHENLDLFKTSLLFTATTRGIPQVYYGTEILTKSPIERNDGVLRADMPGGWDGDSVNAFNGQGLSKEQREAQSYVKKLFNWRKTNGAVKSGKLLHYIPQDGCYVYFRYDGKHTVMVVLNKNQKDTMLDLTRFKPMLKNAAHGRNVMTDEAVDLRVPMPLKAMTSVAVEW
ncbi:glycoside hydrolase family 13 protein [Undibacterium sp. Jales W-56]|uniref:glycoside hydrolase family 13 protein n=1 Tax=Undibacterium sp. Jales W-56 TaxID=2897325 RepID=UPI0021CEE7AE|nr:glycoside hydrolase family 13 protein [Undibacterium sp. Jales W-56]MCU6435183.1 glycoside hydrolase family 13 protein [Undibacterium sp. Jales W-56]